MTKRPAKTARRSSYAKMREKIPDPRRKVRVVMEAISKNQPTPLALQLDAFARKLVRQLGSGAPA